VLNQNSQNSKNTQKSLSGGGFVPLNQQASSSQKSSGDIFGFAPLNQQASSSQKSSMSNSKGSKGFQQLYIGDSKGSQNNRFNFIEAKIIPDPECGSEKLLGESVIFEKKDLEAISEVILGLMKQENERISLGEALTILEKIK